MTTTTDLTAAEQLHRGCFAEMHIEEAVDQLWPDLVGRTGSDHYDNSLEVFFLKSAPADLACTAEQAQVIFKLGFYQAWLNFCDGTEQHIIDAKGGIQIGARHAAANPRGGLRESMVRSGLLALLDEQETKLKEYRGETMQIAMILSLVGRALEGKLDPNADYKGKPISAVETAMRVYAQAQVNVV